MLSDNGFIDRSFYACGDTSIPASSFRSSTRPTTKSVTFLIPKKSDSPAQSPYERCFSGIFKPVLVASLPEVTVMKLKSIPNYGEKLLLGSRHLEGHEAITFSLPVPDRPDLVRRGIAINCRVDSSESNYWGVEKVWVVDCYESRKGVIQSATSSEDVDNVRQLLEGEVVADDRYSYYACAPSPYDDKVLWAYGYELPLKTPAELGINTAEALSSVITIDKLQHYPAVTFYLDHPDGEYDLPPGLAVNVESYDSNTQMTKCRVDTIYPIDCETFLYTSEDRRFEIDREQLTGLLEGVQLFIDPDNPDNFVKLAKKLRHDGIYSSVLPAHMSLYNLYGPKLCQIIDPARLAVLPEISTTQPTVYSIPDIQPVDMNGHAAVRFPGGLAINCAIYKDGRRLCDTVEVITALRCQEYDPACQDKYIYANARTTHGSDLRRYSSALGAASSVKTSQILMRARDLLDGKAFTNGGLTLKMAPPTLTHVERTEMVLGREFCHQLGLQQVGEPTERLSLADGSTDSISLNISKEHFAGQAAVLVRGRTYGGIAIQTKYRIPRTKKWKHSIDLIIPSNHRWQCTYIKGIDKPKPEVKPMVYCSWVRDLLRSQQLPVHPLKPTGMQVKLVAPIPSEWFTPELKP